MSQDIRCITLAHTHWEETNLRLDQSDHDSVLKSIGCLDCSVFNKQINTNSTKFSSQNGNILIKVIKSADLLKGGHEMEFIQHETL